MYDLFVPADTVVEILKTATTELPFSSRKINTFFIFDDNAKNDLTDYLIIDNYGRYHIRHHTVSILPVFKKAMKAKQLFIVEPFSKYNIVIRGSDILLDVIQNNNVFIEENQISQLIIPYNNLEYIITKIELPNNIEKTFIVASSIAAELKNMTDWVYDSTVQKKVKQLLAI